MNDAVPIVAAHLMPWFEAPPQSAAYGWHWTMNTFHPERSPGNRQEIASHYRPLIGAYDSGSDHVIEYHLLLMTLAGIQAIIVDWYGRSTLYDYAQNHRTALKLLDACTRIGIRFAVCYEDQTIPKLVRAGRIAVSERVSEAKKEIAWLQSDWFRRKSYLRIDGAPLLLSFGSEGLTDDEWAAVLPPRGASRGLRYLSEHRQRSAADGAFDWPVPSQWPASLDSFRTTSEKADSNSTYVPVAFPRFHDIYMDAKVSDGYGRIPDNSGKTFAETWNRAIRTGAPLVQIATWNDWGEGTQIEPSTEFAYRDLELIQKTHRERVRGFSFLPDDLRLPLRLYRLRVAKTTSADSLDKVATFLIRGDTGSASRLLDRLEADDHK